MENGDKKFLIGVGSGRFNALGKRYPWRRWFKVGSFHVLRKGRDWGGKLESFIQQLRNMAGPEEFNVRMAVEISADEGEVRLTILGKKKRRKPCRR